MKYLIWDRDANRFGEVELYQALSACNQLKDNCVDLTDGSAAGDWHLANHLELESILHMGYTDPDIPNTNGTGGSADGPTFVNIVATSVAGYRTSSTYDWAAHGGCAGTRFHEGLVLEMNYGAKTEALISLFHWDVRNDTSAKKIQKVILHTSLQGIGSFGV